MNVISLNKIGALKVIVGISLLLFSLTIILTSCNKYTTPKKTERIIQKDSWQINAFVLDGISITESFVDKPMTFEEDGTIFIKGILGSSGNWSTGLNKNPAILYLSSFADDPFFALNNDWEVVSLSKKSMELESNGNQITFVKVE